MRGKDEGTCCPSRVSLQQTRLAASTRSLFLSHCTASTGRRKADGVPFSGFPRSNIDLTVLLTGRKKEGRLSPKDALELRPSVLERITKLLEIPSSSKAPFSSFPRLAPPTPAQGPFSRQDITPCAWVLAHLWPHHEGKGEEEIGILWTFSHSELALGFELGTSLLCRWEKGFKIPRSPQRSHCWSWDLN